MIQKGSIVKLSPNGLDLKNDIYYMEYGNTPNINYKI